MSAHSGLHEALAHCVRRGLTFAAFRVPGEPVRLWAQRDPRETTTDWPGLSAKERVFIMAPFAMDPGQVPFVRAEIELTFPQDAPHAGVLDECAGAEETRADPGPATARQDFLDAVNAARQACAQGVLAKVVLSRAMDADIPPERWPGLFTWALEDNHHTLVAMARTPSGGLWMGASPERLVTAKGNHVSVDSIAATRPAESLPPTLREWGPKELDEQGKVTTYVRDILERLHLGDVKTVGPAVLAAGPVAHLHTVLEAGLGDVPLAELVARLHPTPAVCGVPTGEAQHFIRSHEKHDRSLYAGFWGPWNPSGRTDLFVNLRCMRHVAGRTQLMVGAGITRGSEATMEWTETERKARTWLRAPGITAHAD